MEKYKPVPFFFHGSGQKDLDPKHWFKIAFVSRPEGGEPESLHEPGPQCGGGGSQAIKISQLLGAKKTKNKTKKVLHKQKNVFQYTKYTYLIG